MADKIVDAGQPADLHAFARQLPTQNARAHERVLQVQLVDGKRVTEAL